MRDFSATRMSYKIRTRKKAHLIREVKAEKMIRLEHSLDYFSAGGVTVKVVFLGKR